MLPKWQNYITSGHIVTDEKVLKNYSGIYSCYDVDRGRDLLLEAILSNLRDVSENLH